MPPLSRLSAPLTYSECLPIISGCSLVFSHSSPALPIVAWRQLPLIAHLLPQLVCRESFRTRQSFSCSTTIAPIPTSNGTIPNPSTVDEGFYIGLLCCSNNQHHITGLGA
ncbi:hypothetical protein B296_00038932 [Ensete ventricosum]|uniref:Uncharacterized protein n=1 Tax=Ensete ventricosum TaxID=4639 RepID=A0A426Y020_ENSVE|nr:hypothetical protein B296_00038932 [Ensete ventricosum]